MAYSPIAFTIPQYENYANWWIKTYEQGTTTPLSMATDATGGTLLAKAEIDSTGFPVTAGAARFIPFMNAAYDLFIFPTEAEADANDTGNAIQLADNIELPGTGATVKVSINDTTAGFLNGKLVAGNDVTLTEGNDGGNETLTIGLNAGKDGHKFGLQTSHDTDTDHDIVISVGSCADATNVFIMDLTSVLTKRIDADWAEGDDFGGLSTGSRAVVDTPNANTWYHFFLIAKTDGTIDAGWDTSVSAANLLVDASAYTYYRRIASHFTDGSSNITAYHQFNNDFVWDIVEIGTNVTPATGATAQAINAPLGISTKVALGITLTDTVLNATIITNPAQTDSSPTNGKWHVYFPSSDTGHANINIWTDTSSQVNHRSAAGTGTLTFNTFGWYDPF